LRVVTDQAGSPTWARSIAQITCAIARQWDPAGDARQGIYHLASKGAPSRHEFAVKIVELARDRGETQLTPKQVNAILTEDLPAQGAPRPRYSALATAKLERDFGVELPAWDDDLVRYFSAADNVSG
jgi:dTDP-4-dehydrorhamnose reductase